MKFLGLGVLLALAQATPTPTFPEENTARLEKRASISEAATLGFASLNGGTTGGTGGTVTTVSTLPEFTNAVGEKNTAPTIVVIRGVISGNEKVRIGSNKSIIGLPGSGLRGIGLHFRRQKNLIVRNIVSSFVVASSAEDALKIEGSTNVWVDHCEFHSTLNSDKDLYDGAVDSSHGSDFITVSHTYFHDHWKTSLVGHSDNNGAQDQGKLHITYANNYWKNVNSRAPLLRFGTAHIYNSFYENMSSAVNTRMGAQALVQSNVFRNVTAAVVSQDSKEVGFAVLEGNELGGGLANAPAGNLRSSSIPYSFSLLGAGAVPSRVPSEAGAILRF
ncbi:family 1 putative polysaccharide lyase [Cercophora samala]|uniref:Family 1 putative polysaccharide lyase n=1 Tax=Cercophora samala TaxID=330535 RepID=A0AA39YZX2_9PEZI|nr:family 1 putative polysaccharide lyase [Cercophora samala]